MAVGALMNGGYMIPPTFLKRTEKDAMALAKQVIKPETSAMMRYLMRLNAEKGSAKKVDVPGFYVGGKTGTAEKVVNGRYSKTKLLTTFMAVLPADKPRYLITLLLDEPKACPRRTVSRPRAGTPRRPRRRSSRVSPRCWGWNPGSICRRRTS
jgi:cell division protein FtsI (penicillin-binding protein 3)